MGTTQAHLNRGNPPFPRVATQAILQKEAEELEDPTGLREQREAAGHFSALGEPTAQRPTTDREATLGDPSATKELSSSPGNGLREWRQRSYSSEEELERAPAPRGRRSREVGPSMRRMLERGTQATPQKGCGKTPKQAYKGPCNRRRSRGRCSS